MNSTKQNIYTACKIHIEKYVLCNGFLHKPTGCNENSIGMIDTIQFPSHVKLKVLVVG